MTNFEFQDKIIFSGINPSSSKGLHLGNYLGAGKQHVALQTCSQKAYFFVADYHSLNSIFDPVVVRENVLNTYLDYLSFGLTPESENVLFFIESSVPEIAELNIILNNVISMAELKRMHAYKDKFKNGVSEDSINHGLFNYPVLMASDILLFNADIVPVGADQVQHVEMTRTIARHFNKRYGAILKVPEVYINKKTSKVIGIDGENKMSKSLGNSIPIFDTTENIQKQIFSIRTDPNRIHATDPGDPEKNIIFSYLRYLDYPDNEILALEDRYTNGTVGDMDIKKLFFEYYIEYFKDMRSRRVEYASDISSIHKLMHKNNLEARKIAMKVLSKVRRAVGLD